MCPYMSEPHPNSMEGTRCKRKTTACITKNGDPLAKRAKTQAQPSNPLAKRLKAHSSMTSNSSTNSINPLAKRLKTQSSTTSNSSTNLINKSNSNNPGATPAPPPYAQLCAPPRDPSRTPENPNTSDGDTASKGSDPTTIELSDTDGNESVVEVEVIEDNDEELSKCYGTTCERLPYGHDSR